MSHEIIVKYTFKKGVSVKNRQLQKMASLRSVRPNGTPIMGGQ